MKPPITNSVDEYIAQFPADIQQTLEQIRNAIKRAAPDAEEKISYRMPAFMLHKKILVYFAAFKNHIGFYALPSGNLAFQRELSNYKTGKGSVQFPLDKPMPLKLVAEIVNFRIAEISENPKNKIIAPFDGSRNLTS